MKNVNPSTPLVHPNQRFHKITPDANTYCGSVSAVAYFSAMSNKGTCSTLTPKCTSDSSFSLQTPYTTEQVNENQGRHTATVHKQRKEARCSSVASVTRSTSQIISCSSKYHDADTFSQSNFTAEGSGRTNAKLHPTRVQTSTETATLKPPSNIEDGTRDLNTRQIPILDLQLQVWSLETHTSTIALCRNADVGILHRNCKSKLPQAAFEVSVNPRASHRLSVCVCECKQFNLLVKREATAICGSLDPCGCNLALERPDFH